VSVCLLFSLGRARTFSSSTSEFFEEVFPPSPGLRIGYARQESLRLISPHKCALFTSVLARLMPAFFRAWPSPPFALTAMSGLLDGEKTDFFLCLFFFFRSFTGHDLRPLIHDCPLCYFILSIASSDFFCFPSSFGPSFRALSPGLFPPFGLILYRCFFFALFSILSLLTVR